MVTAAARYLLTDPVLCGTETDASNDNLLFTSIRITGSIENKKPSYR